MIIHKSWKAVDYARLAIIGVVAIAMVAAIAMYISKMSGVHAANNNLGVPQVTLNPGGGVLSNATDGLRFTINVDPNYTSGSVNSAQEGQDGVVYRNTRQYCCSAGGPMLNIGGTLYGQSGPAQSGVDWTSIEIVSTSGAASVGARTSSTGDSSATIRYTVERSGREYYMDRTVSYYYPNDYVTDSYSFVIPAGNTEQVKFYIGGDTAPGSSDQGYGIMLTEPVRTIISLNTSSNIMFGFREIQGSRTFDGATSQGFYIPYDTVESGGNIGFVEEASNHDAGLMMQWNLGSTPGTYTGSFEQFSTLQGTNLNATLAESFSEVAGVVDLNISIDNTELEEVTGLGYTITLPTNLLIQGVATSTCGGTLTASIGTGVITLSGVDVDGASNCVVSLPVTSSIAGTYTVDSSSVSNITGFLTNNVGVSKLNVGVYRLSFATSGGTTVQEITEEQGEVVTVPSTTRAGFNFIEWNTLPNGTGTTYAPGNSYTIPANNSTLYAIWESIPYSVTFNTQGGSAVTGLTNQVTGSDIELPDEPERDGYVFVAWNRFADGSGSNYDAGDLFTIPATNVTFYAIWGQEVTITFDGQDDNYFDEWTYLSGQNLWTPEAPGRDGYTFLEWNTAADATGTSYAEDAVFTPTQNMAFYAIWEDADGISLVTENAGPNNGDANNDGSLDSQQANVSTFVSPVTGKPVSLDVFSDDECFITNAAVVSGGGTPDLEYTYPLGLFDFTVECGDPGFSATVTQYYYDPTDQDFVLRKFANSQYATVNDATIERIEIDGRTVLAVSYEVVDGGALDEDGIENGIVVDPAGPATLALAVVPGAPNTGVNSIQLNGTAVVIAIGATVMATILALITTLGIARIKLKK